MLSLFGLFTKIAAFLSQLAIKLQIIGTQVNKKKREDEDLNQLPDVIQYSLIIAFASIIAYSLHFLSWEKFWEIFSRLAISALAAFASGWFIGFLFGIPRKEPRTENDQNSDRTRSSASTESSDVGFSHSTNLYDVSDWLTKILVGVTLTQIESIKSNLKTLLNFLVGDSNKNLRGFLLVILIYFFIVGAVFGYLWATFNYADIFRRAKSLTAYRIRQIENIEEQLNQTQEDIKKQNKKEEMSSHLEHLVEQQFVLKQVPVSQEELVKTLTEVPPNRRTATANKAIQVRHQAWQMKEKDPEKATKLMVRTIPVFEALIEASKHLNEKEFDQTYAELGFALKDKEPPDYKQAQENINKAIQIRGSDWKPDMGQYKAYYELNLAQCMIELGSTEKEEIAKNLEVAKEAELLTLSTLTKPANQSVKKWLKDHQVWLQKERQKYSLTELISVSPDSAQLPPPEDSDQKLEKKPRKQLDNGGNQPDFSQVKEDILAEMKRRLNESEPNSQINWQIGEIISGLSHTNLEQIREQLNENWNIRNNDDFLKLLQEFDTR
jgi:hypothetical protein